MSNVLFKLLFMVQLLGSTSGLVRGWFGLVVFCLDVSWSPLDSHSLLVLLSLGAFAVRA